MINVFVILVCVLIELMFFYYLLKGNDCIFYNFYRVLPKAISWFLVKKFKVKVRIGRINLPYLALKNVNVSKSGFSVVSWSYSILYDIYNMYYVSR